MTLTDLPMRRRTTGVLQAALRQTATVLA